MQLIKWKPDSEFLRFWLELAKLCACIDNFTCATEKEAEDMRDFLINCFEIKLISMSSPESITPEESDLLDMLEMFVGGGFGADNLSHIYEEYKDIKHRSFFISFPWGTNMVI